MSEQGRWLSRAVGELLAARRNELGLTQEKVAQSMRIQRTSLSNIESGKQVLLLDVFYDLCKELSVSPTDILDNALVDITEPSSPLEEIALRVNKGGQP
jgi:transcriptional regulator with XRE-family HTH domain